MDDLQNRLVGSVGAEIGIVVICFEIVVFMAWYCSVIFKNGTDASAMAEENSVRITVVCHCLLSKYSG